MSSDGHMAIVDQANNRNDVWVVDSNWDGKNYPDCGMRHSVKICGVYGWFRPNSTCIPATISWTSTPASGWYNTDHQLTYSVGGSNLNIVESPVGMWLSGQGQGWHDYSVHVWNSCGDVTIHWQGGWDTVAPSTNCSGPATSTWLPAGSSVSWNPTDATSGVASSSFIWDNGSTNGLVPEGIHNITVSATDNAGNSVTETHGPYWLDTVAPVLSLTGPATSVWLNKSSVTTVTWSATDATSGVATQTLTWDNGGATNVSPAQIAEGKRTATITATDNAGNTATQTYGTWWVDTTPPVFESISTDAESRSLNTLVATWKLLRP